MVGNFGSKWHDMDDQHLHIEVVIADDEQDHVVGAEIEDAHAPDRVVDQGAAIEIVGVHIVAVAAAHVPTVRARVENPVLAANLQIDKKIVVPNQGTEVTEPYCKYNCEQMHAPRVQNNRFLRTKRRWKGVAWRV
ncbi:PREDICTED: uncharacterized protein LOC108552729 isoform X2 [Eufriesea mexicana]|uniref:uncharacterized protein LOC108552729 isoform X2 n=1 Tax=Eufriesea mexicana TaxID=516756 RepID=UPI00083C69CB|nr:PREDICTED: uncharacterized protein LOC108552729 isoform X2 [Eufriesea mexicana]